MQEKNEPIALRINDVCRALGISRTSVYKIIAEGQLKTVRIAGRTLVLRTEIERLVSDAARTTH